MRLSKAFRCARRPLTILAAALVWTAFATLVPASSPNSVSQKGREFHPGEVTVKRGGTVQIVNDDGDLLHHAYVESDKFSFDSGDQKPGSRTDIAFPVVGEFEVLCAIHPKMRLLVYVR